MSQIDDSQLVGIVSETQSGEKIDPDEFQDAVQDIRSSLEGLKSVASTNHDTLDDLKDEIQDATSFEEADNAIAGIAQAASDMFDAMAGNLSQIENRLNKLDRLAVGGQSVSDVFKTWLSEANREQPPEGVVTE